MEVEMIRKKALKGKTLKGLVVDVNIITSITHYTKSVDPHWVMALQEQYKKENCLDQQQPVVPTDSHESMAHINEVFRKLQENPPLDNSCMDFREGMAAQRTCYFAPRKH